MFNGTINLFGIDSIIVYLSLLATLIVGIIFGGRDKTVKDYSIANKSLPMPVVTMSLIATLVGGGTIIGDTAELYETGMPYFMALMGLIVSNLIIALFIVPKFNHRFDNSISVSDIMEDLFNSRISKITSLSGLCFCVGLLCMQFVALGNISANFLDIPFKYGVIISASIIIIYSTLGGIKSVAFTDVFQFIILIVILPLATVMIINKSGGLTEIFVSAPPEKLAFFSHPQFWDYAFLFLFFSMPFIRLQPTVIQRFLMAKSVRNIVMAMLAFVTVELLIIFCNLTLSFSALTISDTLPSKQLFPFLISEYMNVGWKGLMIAGIFAAVMSTADSYLNSAAVLTSQFFFSKKQQKVSSMKMITLVLGIIAVFIAFNDFNLIKTYLVVQLLVTICIYVPMSFGLFYFELSAKNYYFSVVTSIIAAVGLFFSNLPNTYIPFIITMISIASLLGSSYIENGGFKFKKKDSIDSNEDEEFSVKFRAIRILEAVINLFQNRKKLAGIFDNDIRVINLNYIAFVAFCIFNLIVPYLMPDYFAELDNKLTVNIRFISAILCGILLVKSFWAKELERILPYYWFFTITFCLPFTATIIFLNDPDSNLWLVNMVLSAIILMGLVNSIVFILIYSLGTIGAIVFYNIVAGYGIESNVYSNMAYASIIVMAAVLIFSRKREVEYKEKLKLINLSSGIVAHELQSPMAAIKMNAETLDRAMNSAEIEEIIVDNEKKYLLKLDNIDYQAMTKSIKLFDDISTMGIETVRSLLLAVRDDIQADDMGNYSLVDTIERILNSYNYDNAEQLEAIRFDHSGTKDIAFQGSVKFLRHIIHNIIRNAFKHGGKGVNIEIWIEEGRRIHIRDNGKGIPESKVTRVFDMFYTTNGSGIGLSLCKKLIEAMDGKIKCKSELGKYTEFIITLPKTSNKTVL